MGTVLANPLPGVPLVESPFFDDIVGSLAIDSETMKAAAQLREQGWAVIDFPESEFDQIAERIKEALFPLYDWEQWRRAGWGNNDGLRIQDAYTFNPDVRRLAVNPRIIALLSKLYGRQAWPFQTLNFPVGTQQHFHSDTVHFSSVPERFMCGVWVALEDVGRDQGPLLYYPGSHKWPIYTNEHVGRCQAEAGGVTTQDAFHPLWEGLVRVNRIEPMQFHAKKGQALIWAANLLHGGSPQSDPGTTRWSQVTHYYFEGCCYYTPMDSDPFYGRISFREPRDIVSGAVIRNFYSGRQVPSSFIDSVIGLQPLPGARLLPHLGLGLYRRLREYWHRV